MSGALFLAAIRSSFWPTESPFSQHHVQDVGTLTEAMFRNRVPNSEELAELIVRSSPGKPNQRERGSQTFREGANPSLWICLSDLQSEEGSRVRFWTPSPKFAHGSRSMVWFVLDTSNIGRTEIYLQLFAPTLHAIHHAHLGLPMPPKGHVGSSFQTIRAGSFTLSRQCHTTME